jgi:DNA repair protein RadC
MNEANTYRTMREHAADERPRERLAAHGPSVLSDAELIAIVLGSGLRGENVVDLARRLLEQSGGLGGLVRADVKALLRVKGLGPAKAAQVIAAVELGRRARDLDPDSRPIVDSPEAVFALLGPRVLGKTKEEVFVLSLDTKNRLIGSASVVSGSVANVNLRPGEVFREPIVLDATSVIVAHNHPSGDPRPSTSDVLVTKELIEAGELLGIRVADHVVLGQRDFVSLRREGLGFERGS